MHAPIDSVKHVQIAAVYDTMGDPHGALEWFERLNLRVPQDPGVLARLGAIHARYTPIHTHQLGYCDSAIPQPHTVGL